MEARNRFLEDRVSELEAPVPGPAIDGCELNIQKPPAIRGDRSYACLADEFDDEDQEGMECALSVRSMLTSTRALKAQGHDVAGFETEEFDEDDGQMSASRSSQLFAAFRSAAQPQKRFPMGSGATDEVDCYIVSPVHRLRISWGIVMTCFVVLEFWLTSFVIVFLDPEGLPGWVTVTTWCSTLAFIADIMVNFRTGYFEGEKLVMSNTHIARNYLRTWCFLDLTATLPQCFVLVLSMLDTLQQLGWLLRLFALLRLTKLPKLVHFVWTLRRSHMQFVNVLLATPAKLIYTLCVLAHINACIWAVSEQISPTSDDSKAWRSYSKGFSWAFITLISGADATFDVEHRLLVMVMLLERIVLIAFAGRKVVHHVVAHHEQDKDRELLHDRLVGFLRARQVPADLQLRAIRHLQQQGWVNKSQRSYQELVDQNFPTALHKDLCQEMWSRHLFSLQLLVRVQAWLPHFARELAALVTEEAYAQECVVYSAGDASKGAYRLLQGSLVLAKDGVDIMYSEGMWFGEKGLVNPSIHHSSTACTESACLLMCVPSKAFHDLLREGEVVDRFQQLCADEVCCGLCGRCGSLGHHFPGQCPLAKWSPEQAWKFVVPARTESYQDVPHGSPVRKTVNSRNRINSSPSGSTVQASGGSQDHISGSFLEYLSQKNLQWLEPVLLRMGVRSLPQLKEVNMVELKVETMKSGEDVAAQWNSEVEHSLSPLCIEAFQLRISMHLFGCSGKDEHLLFLSHAKGEAGTECALIRAEMQQLLLESPEHPANKLAAPVFLDTEDLVNLKEVQWHVRNSYNLAVVLTPTVLTRPWCLVEIATAYEAGVRILPIELYKKGEAFAFPDETYYQQLRSGELLDKEGLEILEVCEVGRELVEAALRELFQTITLPYSPQRAANFRRSELEAVLKQCKVKKARAGTGSPVRSPARRGSTTFGLLNADAPQAFDSAVFRHKLSQNQ